MKNGYRVLDSDIHVIEPYSIWEEYLDPKFRSRGPQRPEGAGWMRMNGRVLPAYADTDERRRAVGIRYRSERFLERIGRRGEGETEQLIQGTTPEGMLRAMDVEGIDVAVVFRTMAAHLIAFDDIDPHLSAAMCRAFNRWLADFCAAAPDRLKGGAQIPLHDVDLAVTEARHAVEKLGARTLVLPSHPIKQRPLYDRAYDPLWAAAQDLDVAVSLHGIQASYTEGMLANRYHSNHVMGHAAGQPVEVMLSLGEVVTGGILSRFPRLRFAFLEGNCSWLPWWLYALDERWKEWGDRELFEQEELPSELFRRQCWVSVDVDETLVRHVVSDVGDENIVVSSDWPHDDSEYPDAISTFLAMEGTSDDSKRRILWDNCARLYGLGPGGHVGREVE